MDASTLAWNLMDAKTRVFRAPRAYFDFFRSAAHRPTEVVLPDAISARRLRVRLYTFREALLSAPDAEPRCALVAPLVSIGIRNSTLRGEPRRGL